MDPKPYLRINIDAQHIPVPVTHTGERRPVSARAPASLFFCSITLKPRVQLYTKSMSLEYEPASEPLHIPASPLSATQRTEERRCHHAPASPHSVMATRLCFFCSLAQLYHSIKQQRGGSRNGHGSNVSECRGGALRSQ